MKEFLIPAGGGAVPHLPKYLQKLSEQATAVEQGVRVMGPVSRAIERIAVDSTCNTCSKPPHLGLPYRRIDQFGVPIDTIKP